MCGKLLSLQVFYNNSVILLSVFGANFLHQYYSNIIIYAILNQFMDFIDLNTNFDNRITNRF